MPDDDYSLSNEPSLLEQNQIVESGVLMLQNPDHGSDIGNYGI